jgi:ABC-type bacteriocin/lantibiotic exporter with double-glycine peptidase domain
LHTSEVRLSSWVPSELRWLAQQIRPYVHWHVASFLCITAGTLLALLTPLILKWLIDRVLPQRQTGLLLCAVALIFLSNEGRTAFTSLGNYFTLNAVQKMALRLRLDLLRHLDRLSADYYESTQPGTAMYSFKEPIDEIAYFGSDLLPSILRTCLATSFTIVTMCMLSPALTWAILPLIPVFLVMRQHFRARLASDSDKVQLTLVGWSSFLEEHISSILSIQLLGREKRQERIAFRLLARTARSHVRLFQSGVRFTVCTSLAFVLAMAAVIGYGGWSVIAGTLSLGGLVAFYSFITQLFEPLSGAAELYARAQRAFSSIRQLQSVLALQPSIADSDAPVPFPQQHWELRFSEVVFRYERQRETLRVPFLQILSGEKVAIVGENGAGKSTLARLIARAYDVSSGSICVRNEDIRNIRLNDLRQNVCYLPRDPVLFEGSLASNLRFIRQGALEPELHGVLQEAGLTNFVTESPQGLHQRIGPDGCQLSGGQRQRLAIARALLQRPRILILDEATSCLDPTAETLVLGNLQRCLPSTTLIVVSHRPSTIRAFDRVLVLSGGRIVTDGGVDTLFPNQTAAWCLARVASSAGETSCESAS